MPSSLSSPSPPAPRRAAKHQHQHKQQHARAARPLVAPADGEEQAALVALVETTAAQAAARPSPALAQYLAELRDALRRLDGQGGGAAVVGVGRERPRE